VVRSYCGASSLSAEVSAPEARTLISVTSTSDESSKLPSVETANSGAALHKFAPHGHCGTKGPARTFKSRKSISDRGASAKRRSARGGNVLRHFRISQRRRLRDALVAGTIAAAAVGVGPRLACAHAHSASRQVSAHHASKEIPAAEGLTVGTGGGHSAQSCLLGRIRIRRAGIDRLQRKQFPAKVRLWASPRFTATARLRAARLWMPAR
jgi:hypothetical protein